MEEELPVYDWAVNKPESVKVEEPVEESCSLEEGCLTCGS